MACKSDLTGLRNSSVALTSVSIEGCPAIALNLRTKCAWTMNEQLELYQFFDRVLKDISSNLGIRILPLQQVIQHPVYKQLPFTNNEDTFRLIPFKNPDLSQQSKRTFLQRSFESDYLMTAHLSFIKKEVP